jgi:threonine dehydrogenase-like Zn-dependent dehydrogenase
MPVVLGHEAAGVVLAINGDAPFAIGDRVVTDPIVRCGMCRLCVTGRPNICEQRQQIGFHIDGALSERALVPITSLVPLPTGIRWNEAPLMETLAVGVHALERAGAVFGQPCAIVGPGPVGLLLLQALKAAGAYPIVMVGRQGSEARLALARAMGATETCMANDEALVSMRNEFEVSFEVAGSATALELAVSLTRRGGRIVEASGFDEPTSIRFNRDLKLMEIDLLTSTAHPPTAWSRAFGLVASGAVRLSGIVDMVVPLADATTGFMAASDRKIVKCVVRCDSADPLEDELIPTAGSGQGTPGPQS